VKTSSRLAAALRQGQHGGYGIQKLWDANMLEARWENCTGDSAEEKAKEAETVGRHLRRYFHITSAGRRYLDGILKYRK
jgi:hypothetical protein